jgi:RNA polymerase sigma-70 factor (ECF subfamily)
VRREETDADDAEVAARAVHDRAAFGVLYDRYATVVFRYCYRRLGERGAAEDATSATFLKAIESLPGYRGGSFPAWLFAIAHSVVVTTARRRTESALDESYDVADGEPSPEDAAMAADDRRRIVRLLAGLPEDQRRVIELRLAGLSGAEIAMSIGRSVSAVKMLQHRAMTNLRRRLTAPAATGDHPHA